MDQDTSVAKKSHSIKNKLFLAKRLFKKFTNVFFICQVHTVDNLYSYKHIIILQTRKKENYASNSKI